MDLRRLSTNFRDFDWLLLAAALLLSLFGLISIISTTSPGDSFFSTLSVAQIIFIFIGVTVCFWLSYLEYRSLQSFAFILYILSLLLLLAVLFFGEVRNGTKAWFNLGFFNLQPSEIGKLALILILAFYFSRKSIHNLRQVFTSLLFLVAPLGLVLLEPDFGTALAYIMIWFIMILSLNLRRRELVMMISAACLLVFGMLLAMFFLMPKEHFQYRRLQVYPDHLLLNDTYHTDVGYQVDQSLIAFGSGRIFGKGIGQGTQNHLGFLPEAPTDFIFSSIGEELGLIGIIIVLTLVGTLLFRTLRVAHLAQDKFGRFTAVGIFGLYFFHLFENIGMNIGLLPVTGVPMTFVSYGGSHLLTAYACLGLLQSILLRYKKIKY